MRTSLSEYLSPSRLERVICLEETESTNTYLKNFAADAPNGLAVIARRQSGGRGRVGRSFSSPEGGVYLSVLYRGLASPAHFTPCAAVAVCRAIKIACGISVDIKWVNDLLIEGKKVCGILTEMQDGCIIVGVGVNVRQRPEGLPNAACLADFGADCSMEALSATIIAELDAMAADYPSCVKAFRAEYADACLNLGREVLVIRGDSKKVAFAESLDEDFSLLVRYPDGSRESIFYGEVSLRAPNGEYI